MSKDRDRPINVSITIDDNLDRLEAYITSVSSVDEMLEKMGSMLKDYFKKRAHDPDYAPNKDKDLEQW
jgi:hypothetical protein